MGDLISREEVLDLLDTAFESGAFDGRYAYENLIDAVQNLIHPLETDLVSRQAVIDTIETDCSWDIFNEWGARTHTGENIINAIKSVPSVEPERKTESGELIKYSVHGHDACKCSKCNMDLGYPYEGRFCKWCGTKMEVEV